MSLLFESTAKLSLPFCFGSREFNEKSVICLKCEFYQKCKESGEV